jgi:hypothetical protein
MKNEKPFSEYSLPIFVLELHLRDRRKFGTLDESSKTKIEAGIKTLRACQGILINSPNNQPDKETDLPDSRGRKRLARELLKARLAWYYGKEEK